jgi:hypothetical protein
LEVITVFSFLVCRDLMVASEPVQATQDVIDACKPTDTNAKCIICLQLDKHVRAGFGYQKYTHTKPDVSVLGQDAAFIGRIRLEEMERQVGSMLMFEP